MPHITEQLLRVKEASRTLVSFSDEKRKEIINDLADALLARKQEILEANKRDCTRMDENDPKYDRLLLNDTRIEAIANDIRTVADLPSPLHQVLEERTLPSGLLLQRVSVPLGVVGVIYEARPNVTFDVFSLCFKSGNACVLKGGSDAQETNEAAVRIIHSVLEKHGVSQDVAALLPAGRDETLELLSSTDFLDVIIPRGSQNLINFVREHAKVPVIETGAGIVHTYIDASADTVMAARIVYNAKTRRPSVCNALDTLIVHEAQLSHLPKIVAPLAEKQVQIFADEQSFAALDGHYPEALLAHATEEHFGTEFLSLKLSLKTVASAEEAVNHIAQYSSKHSEAIIAEDEKTIEYFLNTVDAAAVYANASTAFTDGAQFGLGAEIGISTQKLHARGPMGLRELTSYKWVLHGHGEIRK